MDRKSNIFWGIVLVVVGFLFLGTNLDWFHLDWSFRQIARFWPLMLIAAGAAAFFNHKKSVYNATSALLIAFAIPLGLYTCVDDGVRDFKDEVRDGFNIDIDDDDDEDDNFSKKDTASGDRNKQYYAVEITPDIKEATLNLKGGAAEFDLEESGSRLFEATTFLEYKGGYTLEEEKKDGSKSINFEMKNKNNDNFHFDMDNNNIDNDVLLKLNTSPLWNIDMKIGAGEVDFDLSKYKVKKLNLETGAASIDIKLGDLHENVEVDIKSGVASVKIQVPESIGCEIRMDGALNAKDFDDFEKVKDGVWQTKGYDKTSKKIKLDVESGLSSLKVSRY